MSFRIYTAIAKCASLVLPPANLLCTKSSGYNQISRLCHDMNAFTPKEYVGLPVKWPAAGQQRKPEDEHSSWPHPCLLLFLTFSSATAIYQSRNDPWTVAFVSFAYLDLLLLFCCLRLLERAPESSPRRSGLKVAVWFFSTFLTLLFSYRVALIMPLAVKVAVWAMAGLSISAGFYAFFVYRSDKAAVVAAEPSLL